jgi:hypothetical protein
MREFVAINTSRIGGVVEFSLVMVVDRVEWLSEGLLGWFYLGFLWACTDFVLVAWVLGLKLVLF